MIQKIVIIGGGIAGLGLAIKLGKKLKNKKKYEIILVDKQKGHIWKPMLHKIASGNINYNYEIVSYLFHAKKNNFSFILGKMIKINRKEKHVIIQEKHNKKEKTENKIKFDILIIAIGSVTNDFNIPGVINNCLFLDNQKQANNFYKKMLNKFKENLIKNKKTKIAIVGGGLTGVELSTEILNTINKLEKYKFYKINKKKISITIIESENNILPKLPFKISKIIHKNLEKLGIYIKTNTKIKKIENKTVETELKEKIKFDIITWTTGIKISDSMKNIGGLITNKNNQLIIKKTLQTKTDKNIFAIGDCASYEEENKIQPRAQNAHQMTKTCYKNIILLINKSKKLKKYKYKDYGYLISLSSFKTIGIFHKILFLKEIILNGKIAELIYISLYKIHLINIHGFIKTILIILTNIINKKIKPKLKLY